jgi:hypothetical protein
MAPVLAAPPGPAESKVEAGEGEDPDQENNNAGAESHVSSFDKYLLYF